MVCRKRTLSLISSGMVLRMCFRALARSFSSWNSGSRLSIRNSGTHRRTDLRRLQAEPTCVEQAIHSNNNNLNEYSIEHLTHTHTPTHTHTHTHTKGCIFSPPPQIYTCLRSLSRCPNTKPKDIGPLVDYFFQ